MERKPTLGYSFFQYSYPEMDESNPAQPVTASSTHEEMEQEHQPRTPHFKVYHNQCQRNGHKLYLNVTTSDVTFSIGANHESVTKIAAHKSMLAAASDVFETMFFGKSKLDGNVQVKDVSEAAFKEFLQYFYLNEVKLTAENIGDVMHLGHKYNVKQCINDCVGFIIDILNDENVCSILFIGNRYNQSELIKLCERRIMMNTSAIFKTIGFLMCEWETLAHILNMNLFSCTEVVVFEACMAWVRAKSEQISLSQRIVKRYLGDLYYQIRFASMSIAEFCALDSKYNAVLDKDFKPIIHMIANKDGKSLPKFNARPRHAEWNANAIIKCDRKSSNGILGRFTLLSHEKVIFSTNKPLLLGGFRCGRIMVNGRHNSSDRNLRSDLPVKVEITERQAFAGLATDKMVSNLNARLQSTETNVLLPHPLLIRPGFIYTICIGKFPDEHVSYANELKHNIRIDADINIQFHNCFAENGKIFELIPMLNFNRL